MKHYYSSERNVDTIAEIDRNEFGPIRHPNRYAADFIFGMQYPLIARHVEAIERDMCDAMSNKQDGRKKTQRAIEIDHELWTPDQPEHQATPGQLADIAEDLETRKRLTDSGARLEKLKRPTNTGNPRMLTAKPTGNRSRSTYGL